MNPQQPNLYTPPQASYRRETHRPLNQLLLIGPLLVVFHVGSEFLGSSLLVPVYLRDVLASLGVTGRYLPAAAVLAVLLGQHLARKEPLRASGWVAAGMLLEAALWVLPVLAISWLTHPGPAGAAVRAGPIREVLEAIGAGVYEEFLFRLVFVSALLLLGVDLLGLPRLAVTVAAVSLSGVLFAACHFPLGVWTGESPLSGGRAVFLAAAGAWWGVLFLWRGYAVAAVCHVVWDLLVIGLSSSS